MAKEKNIPEIRFKGFQGEWEEKKVCDIFKVTRGNVLAATQTTEKQTEETLYPVYSSQTKNDGLMGYYNKYLFENAITWTTDGANAGTVNYREGKFYSTNVNGVLLSENGYANKAVAESLNKVAWRHVSKVGNPKLMNNVMSEIPLTLPANNNELIAISNHFQNLDSLISLQQSKYNKLLTVKKAMLEKMFPKEGADVPEIRFKGFEGKWEKKKLGGVGAVVMNRRIFKEQTTDIGEIPFYKIGTFGGKPDAYITRVLFDEYKSKYPYPKYGDILISASGSIGRTVEYLGADEYFQDSNIVWLEHDESITNIFLKYFYTVVKWEGLEGSTIKRLYNKNILETKIYLPTVEEQTKIGTFFQTLDTLISEQQKQLEKLKNIKKACLEKMFV